MPGSDVYKAGATWLCINIDELDQLPEEEYELMEECSPNNHVTKDALPTLLRYDRPLDAAYNVHRACFGVALGERMDAVGARCELIAGRQPVAVSNNKTIHTFIRMELAKT